MSDSTPSVGADPDASQCGDPVDLGEFPPLMLYAQSNSVDEVLQSIGVDLSSDDQSNDDS